MRFLKLPVSEEVRRMEYLGMFESCRKWLQRELSDRKLTAEYRKRLEFELFRLELIKRSYVLSESEAYRAFRRHFDGTREEFVELRDKGVLDWRWVDGARRFESRFDSNLAFSNGAFSTRFKGKAKVERDRRTRYINGRISELLSGARPKKFRVRVAMSLFAKNPKGKYVRVWMPFPKEMLQQSDVVLLDTSHEPTVASNDVGQRTICMEGLDTETFEVQFEYTVSEWIGQSSDINNESLGGPNGGDLGELPPHVVFTEIVRETLALIFDGKDPREFDDVTRARRIFDYVTLNVNYSFVLPYALYDNIVEYVLTSHRGDCGFQALTFITLCRACGVPAKWQSGWSVVPWSASPHDWALVHLEEYGWVPVDLSFGGGRRGDENLRLFYFTGLDGFRMFANTEFQSEFDPPKHSWRLDPYDNQVGEMEYIEVPETPVFDLEHNIRVLSFDEL